MSYRHRRRYMNALISLLGTGIVLLAELIYSSPAHAYTLENCNFAYYPGKGAIGHPATSAYAGVVDGAETKWNAVSGSSTLYFYDATPGNESIDSYDENYGNTGYDGITHWGCSSGKVKGIVTSDLNRYYADGYTHLEKIIVMTHEFGHAVGLGHQSHSGCNAPPIMTPSAIQPYLDCGRQNPQGDDVAGINHLY